METTKGKFIVIDGTDGTGKTTQLNLLKIHLEKVGYQVRTADFPQYNTKSAGPIEEYLSGKYGTAEEVGPYKASIFYATDRYDASFKIREWLQAGYIVLANRYTSANMGHQGGKINNSLERKVFFNWLDNLEYKIFEIPRPDLTIILHVEADIAQKLAQKRSREDWKGKIKDIHEGNLHHLQQAEQVYLEIANTFPNFQLISCTRNKKILNREEINSLIWIVIKKILNEGNSKTKDFQDVASIMSSNQQLVANQENILKHINLKKINNLEIEKNEMPKITQNKNNNLELKIERLNSLAKLPQKAHSNDAAYDLYANDYYSIAPYNQTLVSTGIKLAIPHNCVGLIWDKSGLASRGITTLGGVIDSNYRGEIKVIIKNLSEEIFNIIPGQKIAQILIQEILNLKIKEEKLDNLTERQDQGFGSSGQF